MDNSLIKLMLSDAGREKMYGNWEAALKIRIKIDQMLASTSVIRIDNLSQIVSLAVKMRLLGLAEDAAIRAAEIVKDKSSGGYARCLLRLGYVYAEKGEFDKASKMVEDSLQIYDRLGLESQEYIDFRRKDLACMKAKIPKRYFDV